MGDGREWGKEGGRGRLLPGLVTQHWTGATVAGGGTLWCSSSASLGCPALPSLSVYRGSTSEELPASLGDPQSLDVGRSCHWRLPYPLTLASITVSKPGMAWSPRAKEHSRSLPATMAHGFSSLALYSLLFFSFCSALASLSS